MVCMGIFSEKLGTAVVMQRGGCELVFLASLAGIGKLDELDDNGLARLAVESPAGVAVAEVSAVPVSVSAPLCVELRAVLEVEKVGAELFSLDDDERDGWESL